VLDGGASATQTETVAAPPATGGSGGAPAPGTPPASGDPLASTPTPKPAPKPQPRVVGLTKRFVAGHLVVAVRVASGSTRPAGIAVRIRVRRGSSTVANVTRVTAKGGVATWRSAKKLRPSAYVATAAVR
jgi:hypothetical protein